MILNWIKTAWSFVIDLFDNARNKKYFIDVLKEHLAHDALESSLSDRTKEKHIYLLNNVIKFLTETKLTKLRINKIRARHAEQLRIWLHKNITLPNGKPCAIDHVSRHIRMCRSACTHAVKQEYIDHNPLNGVKAKKSPTKDVVSLSIQEVERFEKYEADRDLWNKVRDLFLFQCFTGLSYGDLWKFQIVFDQDIWWITCESGRRKTKKIYWAEWTKRAQNILLKYDGKLPEVSLQTYNNIVKRIAIELNISKKLSTHIGRKTFATLKRNEGYSIPAISGMLGSTEEIVRKHYITEGKEHIISERLKLKKPKSRRKNLAA